jgi:hypothetical protein
MTDIPKIKVSREEFAEALAYWLAKQVNTQALKETAKAFDLKDKPEELFGLNLKNKRDSDTLAKELFALNMWLIVHSCETVFEDTNKRNECLDMFHLIVYQKILGGTEEDFDQWKLAATVNYADYNEAIKTEGTPGPFWQLATVVNKNMFGKLNLDAFVQFQISVYASSTIKALLELISEYEIE